MNDNLIFLFVGYLLFFCHICAKTNKWLFIISCVDGICNLLTCTCRLQTNRFGVDRLDTGSGCSGTHWCDLTWSELL